LAHATLARASLGVLLQLDDRVDKDSISDFPLADYAARHWFEHGQFENVSLTIRDATERLFDREKPYFSAWVWIYDIDDPWREPTPTTHPEWPEAPPLYYAILCGFRWLIEHLIATYPGDVNSRGGWHETPLLAALMTEDTDTALLLLRCGADVNVLDNEGWSPLHRVSFYGRVDIVRFLVEHSADVNLPGYKHFTPLTLASRIGEMEISRFLVQHGADVNAGTIVDWTPLSHATLGGHLDLVQLLIDNGADVNFPNYEGSTSLHMAADIGRLDIVKLLLESGADFNIRSKDGRTPLDTASDSVNHEVASFLSGRMAASMSLEGVMNPTPSTIKRRNRFPKVVQALQKSGEEVNSSENEQPSLYTASEDGQLDTVRSFLDCGSDVNALFRNRMTALHAASSKGKLEVAKLLIERGAYVDLRSRAGWTPLHNALREGNLEVARLLLDHGAHVNAKTRNDGNALHLALLATFVAFEATQLLLERGADVDVRNNRGRTPRQEAKIYGAHKTAGLLSDRHCGTC